jgi:hypothetical protein
MAMNGNSTSPSLARSKSWGGKRGVVVDLNPT